MLASISFSSAGFDMAHQKTGIKSWVNSLWGDGGDGQHHTVWLSDNTGPYKPYSNGVAPLTAEEEARLHELRKQHKDEIRQTRLEYFKLLAPEVRAHIILTTRAAIEKSKMASLLYPPTGELVELESRRIAGGGSMLDSYRTNYGDLFHQSAIAIEENPMVGELGVSLSDLEKAHADAALEEQLLATPPQFQASNVGNC